MLKSISNFYGNFNWSFWCWSDEERIVVNRYLFIKMRYDLASINEILTHQLFVTQICVNTLHINCLIHSSLSTFYISTACYVVLCQYFTHQLFVTVRSFMPISLHSKCLLRDSVSILYTSIVCYVVLCQYFTQ